MFRNKTFITIFLVFLLCCGLFLLYTSNINKNLFVDIYAENSFIADENRQAKDIHITKYNDNFYTFLLPANFLYQTKTISFQNTNNQNVQLVFYTEQKKDNNKEIEFSINIKSIKVNGQNYHNKKQTVWYERPYIDAISVNKDEVISLTVKYKTKLILRNMYMPQFVLSIVFLLFSLLSLLLLWRRWLCEQIDKIIRNAISFLEKHGEWDTLFIQKYKDIDVIYKKAFWIVFAVLNIVFLYYNIHFIWGNHDWNYVMHGLWGSVSWFNGRYTNYLPNQLLGGRFLPILTVALGLFGFSFTGILLAYYWKVQKNLFNYLVISFVVVLNPLVIYWAYFSRDVVSHLWLPSIMILALILSEKKSFYNFIIAYLLFIFGLGIYASGIVTIAVVFLGKIIITYSFDKQSIVFLYKNFRRTLCCISLSLLSFKIIISILSMLALVLTSIDRVQMNLLGGSIEKFLEIIKNSYIYLTYSVPFYDSNIITLLIGLSLFSFITLCWYQKKYNGIKFFQLCFIIAGILLLPLASNLTGFICGYGYWGARVLFYGYIFLGAFWVVIILKTKVIWAKNILIVFLIFLLPMNVYRLIDAQKLWKIEFDYQNRAIERIVGTLQDSSYYLQNQGVHVVTFGVYMPHTVSFYKEKFTFYETIFGYSSLNSWPLTDSIGFFDTKLKINGISMFTNTGYMSPIKDMTESKCIQMLLPYYNTLKNELASWPAGKSILVKDNYIFINFDNAVLQKVIEALEEKRKELNEVN